jgi:hypothetical protein
VSHVRIHAFSCGAGVSHEQAALAAELAAKGMRRMLQRLDPATPLTHVAPSSQRGGGVSSRASGGAHLNESKSGGREAGDRLVTLKVDVVREGADGRVLDPGDGDALTSAKCGPSGSGKGKRPFSGGPYAAHHVRSRGSSGGGGGGCLSIVVTTSTGCRLGTDECTDRCCVPAPSVQCDIWLAAGGQGFGAMWGCMR